MTWDDMTWDDMIWDDMIFESQGRHDGCGKDGTTSSISTKSRLYRTPSVHSSCYPSTERTTKISATPEINRANAQYSTGPKTASGKKAASRNALRQFQKAAA